MHHGRANAPTLYLRIEPVCVQCMCLQTEPKKNQLSVAVIRELLNCQMGEGGARGGEREEERQLPTEKESRKEK